MSLIKIKQKLTSLKKNIELDELEIVCEEIDNLDDGLNLIPDLFALLEDNPDLDFGSPGTIVHTMEKYFNKGYEALLVHSICQLPTQHTIWMLNRVINGTKDIEQKQYITLMQEVAGNPLNSKQVCDLANHFLSN